MLDWDWLFSHTIENGIEFHSETNQHALGFVDDQLVTESWAYLDPEFCIVSSAHEPPDNNDLLRQTIDENSIQYCDQSNLHMDYGMMLQDDNGYSRFGFYSQLESFTDIDVMTSEAHTVNRNDENVPGVPNSEQGQPTYPDLQVEADIFDLLEFWMGD